MVNAEKVDQSKNETFCLLSRLSFHEIFINFDCYANVKAHFTSECRCFLHKNRLIFMFGKVSAMFCLNHNLLKNLKHESAHQNTYIVHCVIRMVNITTGQLLTVRHKVLLCRYSPCCASDLENSYHLNT